MFDTLPNVFTELLEATVGLSDEELDIRLREAELAFRQLTAERAALVAVIEQRGVYAADGHRSMSGYLRATCNTSSATGTRDRRIATLLSEYPIVGDALRAGRISIDHVVAITTVHRNPRIGSLLGVAIEVFVELAEHGSYREFETRLDEFTRLADQDGAFDDLADSIGGRSARVTTVGDGVDISAHGGDPIQAAQLTAIFERFVDAEYRRDVEARRAERGDDAHLYDLARTPAQRRFDAMVAIYSAAAASPDGRALPEPEVHLVVDERTVHEALTHAGITLPSGETIDLDDDGDLADPERLLNDLAAELAADPESFLGRRCRTANGTPVHPSVVLRALLTGHVRRVVVNSRGVVVDYGTRQRLFRGLARQAAMILVDRCQHPGCDLPARWSQVDHNVEWIDSGVTDQDNANIECGHHNVFKHRKRWRTRRDPTGRSYTVRDDGSIVLPVGERPPDLSIDEQTELIRARVATLPRPHRSATHP